MLHLLRLVYSGGTDGSTLFWVVMYPMALFMSLGVENGVRYSISLFIVLLLLVLPTPWLTGKYNYPVMMTLRFLFSYIAVVLFSYSYEKTRIRNIKKSADYMIALEDSTKELLQAKLDLEKLSYIDNLTGCYNRLYLYKNINKELTRAKRKHPFTIILCDIDFFKKVNDNYGHIIGDSVLKKLGSFLNESVREDLDWVVRFGGEEFLIILPDTKQSEAEIIAERIRTGFSGVVFKNNKDHGFSITLSLGVISDDKGNIGTMDFHEIYMKVDENLYKAKNAGRDQICISGIN